VSARVVHRYGVRAENEFFSPLYWKDDDGREYQQLDFGVTGFVVYCDDCGYLSRQYFDYRVAQGARQAHVKTCGQP
jgi:hypothetical protein